MTAAAEQDAVNTPEVPGPLPPVTESAAEPVAGLAEIPAEQPAETPVAPVPAEAEKTSPAAPEETPAAQPTEEAPATPESPAPGSEGEQPSAPAETAPPVPEAPQPEPEVKPTEPAKDAAVTRVPAAEQTPAPADNRAAYRGIVRIEVAKRMPDYKTPWNTGVYGRANGTGFMVGKGLFMTNAHVVANAERIYISPYADSRQIPAHVRHVAHDADLALVEAEDATAFENIPCLKFSTRMPRLEDTVRAIGYPIGGNRLSVTRGIVSRIDTVPYSHPRNESHLTVQIDAAINPGNSGGPVLMGDGEEVVGVAFQGLLEANSTGYMIPLPVINRFLQDVADGTYDRYVDLGAVFFPLRNPAMRRHYGLTDPNSGVLVGDVIRGGTCDGVLQPGDVVLSVNGIPVDSSAMIELDGEHVQLEELAERAFCGDVLRFSILRDGQALEPAASLRPLPASHVSAAEYDCLPRYVVYAGLVFQPLQLNVVQAHRMNAADFVTELDHFQRKGGSLEKDDIVLLTRVLRDEVNARFDNYGKRIVTKVNGVEVTGLSHLYSLLYPVEGGELPPYTVIEFADAARPLIIDNAGIKAANERISTGYNIPEPARLR